MARAFLNMLRYTVYCGRRDGENTYNVLSDLNPIIFLPFVEEVGI
jgi:hypothetical protein